MMALGQTEATRAEADFRALAERAAAATSADDRVYLNPDFGKWVQRSFRVLTVATKVNGTAAAVRFELQARRSAMVARREEVDAGRPGGESLEFSMALAFTRAADSSRWVLIKASYSPIVRDPRTGERRVRRERFALKVKRPVEGIPGAVLAHWRELPGGRPE